MAWYLGGWGLHGNTLQGDSKWSPVEGPGCGVLVFTMKFYTELELKKLGTGTAQNEISES